VTGLDWDKFAELPGEPDRNFELLCRGAIRRNYGSKGDFQSVAQQPGVEFHLRLTQSCDELGAPPRWWGWQCRWYDLPSGRAIGSRRREKIVQAIRTTEKWLPDMTDWVLWTRRPLTPGDQKWFRGIKTKMTLHLRTGEDDLPDLLTGDAAGLRASYFGELVLSPARLSRIRAEGIEAVKRRYNPEVHVKVEAEKVLEQVLGTPSSWQSLSLRATKLRKKATQLRADQRLLDRRDPYRDAIGRLLDDAGVVEARLRAIIAILAERGAPFATALAGDPIGAGVTRRELNRVAARLRMRGEPAALGLHMLEAELRRARRLLAGFAQRASISVCGVVGGAGRGKSNLAIDLTAERDGSPAGVYLQGRNLPRNGTLEDLLGPLISRPAGSFLELLEGLDAAGARAGRRIPLVIDGLNEAEDPARFKALLSSLKIAAAEFPNVLVLLTLRESAFEYALPDEEPPWLELRGFDQEFDEAIERYFAYYKILRGEGRLPVRMLRQPLLLWMFCEVANPGPPEERTPVPLSALPATPVRLYERFRDESVKRIATELLSCAEFDVAGGLDRVALALWDQGVRQLPFEEIRGMIDRDPDWHKSIARALEDEGVLMREPATSWHQQPSGILFDAFAGFLIADAIVRRVGTGGIEAWLRDEENLAKLDPTPGSGHPLATDILSALAGVLPRHAHRQLWQYLDGARREQALIDAADLDRGDVDTETAEAIADVLREGAVPAFRQIMDRLADVRSDPWHPLNATFVDRVLRELDVAERDLRWSEWARTANDPGWPRRTGPLQRDVEQASQMWRQRSSRSEDDRLRALWISWLLTSTDRRLRDHATEALYRFGRGAPDAFFSMTLATLNVNDVYVPERMLAASYGVAMANQRPTDLRFPDAFHDYLRELAAATRGDCAPHPTSHWLMRSYADGAWQLACARYPEIECELAAAWAEPFAVTKAPRGYSDKSRRGGEVEPAIGMDFENYTLGRLYEDRPNYNFTHKNYLAGVAQIRGRIWQLGWRKELFEEIDRRISEEQWRGGRMDRPDRVDRYGKKYGWIAYYELAGRLYDGDGLSPDVTEGIVDIDPSFPDEPPPLPINLPAWARATPARLSDWVRRGIIEVPNGLLVNDAVGEDGNEWVGVYVSLRDHHELAGRQAGGTVEALLVTARVAARLEEALAQLRGWSDADWPGDPSDYYTMAGEIPWSPKFAASLFRYEEHPYRYELDLPGIGRFDAETVTHRYAWEGYHSTTNQQGGLMVPSRLVSTGMGLTKAPDNLDHVDADGRLAARVFLAPEHFERGNALYIRRDVLDSYAKRRKREVVLVVRGERQPEYELISDRPRWYINAAVARADEWGFARRLKNLG
jgi:hypothetical protein